MLVLFRIMWACLLHNLVDRQAKNTAIYVPTSCGRNWHHGVACDLSRLAFLGFAAAQSMNCFLDRDEISSARRFVAWSSSVLFHESASVKLFAGRETKPATHQTEKCEGHDPKIIIPTHPICMLSAHPAATQPGPHRHEYRRFSQGHVFRGKLIPLNYASGLRGG